VAVSRRDRLAHRLFSARNQFAFIFSFAIVLVKRTVVVR